MAEVTVVKGGVVVDGSGAPGRRADLSIGGDGRILEIGSGLSGDRVVDAAGAVVAPGFIDIHTHYDAQVFWDPALTPSPFHGVTTAIAGNCGFSIAPLRPDDRNRLVATMEKVEDMNPATLLAGVEWDSFETFPQYLDAVSRRGPVINVGVYVGHTPVRVFVMGQEASERVATEDEIEAMARMVADAMAAGAVGFATSYGAAHRDGEGRPIPSRLATREEVVRLAREVRVAGRGLMAVNGGDGLTFRDAYELQPEIGVPITFTALLTFETGSHLRALDVHRAARAAGVQVYPQVSCRPLVFSMTMVEPFALNTNPVFAELSGRPTDERRRAFADPAWRQRVLEGWDTMRNAFRPLWDRYSVMESSAHPELIDRRLVDIAAERGVAPFDTLLDLALDEPDLALRVSAVIANDDVDGVTALLREEGCVLGLSDAGAHVGQLCDAPLPTDLLGRWVREREVLSLEQAVHKLTGEPAALFGLADRGVLRPGCWADLTIFDPDTVDPGPLRRVRDFPADGERLTADEAIGIRSVYVAGREIVGDGELRESALADPPGQLVRPGPAT
jgi:N-acyl-D-aspartate/D-glutamate deacylase